MPSQRLSDNSHASRRERSIHERASPLRAAAPSVTRYTSPVMDASDIELAATERYRRDPSLVGGVESFPSVDTTGLNGLPGQHPGDESHHVGLVGHRADDNRLDVPRLELALYLVPKPVGETRRVQSARDSKAGVVGGARRRINVASAEWDIG